MDLLAAVADDVRPTTFERELFIRVAYEFHAAIPDAELRMIPGAGHATNLEQPERVNEVVRTFCRAHPPHPPV